MRGAFSRPVLAIAALLCFTAQGGLATAASKGTFGKPPAARSAFASPADVAIGTVNRSFLPFAHGSIAAGGVGLRNQREGGIEVSGLPGPARFGLLYWAVITQGPPVAGRHNVVTLRKGFGTFTDFTGTVMHTGASPCWNGDRITIYRAVVPNTVASGNGFYTIRLKPLANAVTDGRSPWVSSAPPMVEGASLVLVGSGTATVHVYDTAFAGRMFFDTLTYTLNLAPVSVAGANEVLILNIGADGQIGNDVTASAGTSGEVTTLNGLEIAGPDSPAVNSDWNGALAGPLPQLWDTTIHDVTSEAQATSTPTLLPFTIDAPDDCLVTIANIVSVD